MQRLLWTTKRMKLVLEHEKPSIKRQNAKLVQRLAAVTAHLSKFFFFSFFFLRETVIRGPETKISILFSDLVTVFRYGLDGKAWIKVNSQTCQNLQLEF